MLKNDGHRFCKQRGKTDSVENECPILDAHYYSYESGKINMAKENHNSHPIP
jgi:hypothetical protein